jgi:hypothetical protein
MQYYYIEHELENEYTLVEIDSSGNLEEVLSIDIDINQSDESIRNELAFRANTEFDLGITANDIDYSEGV